MTRLAQFPLAVSAVALLLACQGDRVVIPPVGGPSAAIVDGTDKISGNPDFFFLEPISDPSGDPDFGDRAFNRDLAPPVDVCELSGDPLADDPADPTDDVTCVVTVFGPFTASQSQSAEHYHLNWHTDESNNGAGLDVSRFYRIQVFGSLGGKRLGYADVNPVGTGNELKNLQTGEIVALVDGRTLPIRVRVEEAALCDPPGTDPCSSKTIVLADGGSVVLEETGDRVDIPPQNSGQIITVTLQLCDGIDVDSPQFGNCLTVTADPPLAQNLDPRATVSICSITTDPTAGALSESQEDLLTLYRQDNGAIFALPHAQDFCTQPISTAPGNFYQRLARAFGRLFGPRPLYATTAVLNVGDAGDTETFSRFRLVLPAQMFPLPGTDGQTAAPDTRVANPPGVRVADRDGNAVVGATVRFEVTAGDGTLAVGAVVPCGSDPAFSCIASNADGIAAATSWTLGTAGTNTVRAFGRGIADPDDAGPFMPDNIDAETGQPISPELQTTVAVGTGEVFFHATATAPVGSTIFRATFTNDALDAQPGPPEIGAWTTVDESAGTIRVRSAVGDLENKPVELNQADGLTGGVDLVGTVAGTPPSAGQWVVRWRSLINSADAFFAPIVLRGSGGVILASLEYRSGGQLTYNSPTNDIGIGWAQGTSQLFEIVVDLDATVTSLWINGSPVANQQNVPFVQAATSVERVGAELGGTSAQIFAWDDIEIVQAQVTIDGVLSAGEWEDAAITEFAAALPEGGTTPAQLFVKNDGTNLYLAVRFARSVVDASNLLNFEFDNDNDGAGPENGDDYITFVPPSGFFDAHRSGCPSPCGVTDDGVDHGAGAFGNDGTSSVYEISHPLNSGETGQDFALTPPTVVGMLLQLQIGAVTTIHPAGTFPTYMQINITSP